ncbi:hypothetical protein SAMN04487884_10783 [Butyrivibrio fibrisolvens]|uniref:Uncharacterized protein n=1 Tax=Butyrivibrio fibrisolvens TaxID=831 RepID=A0A1H9Q9I3_BUTFI|nr:DUF6020 family protein [Butyrivibrio fibrisolvens]SER57171.1 hypothetical protein SAMN04487884_10783 [Butyrivibrio fibrisolvens]
MIRNKIYGYIFGILFSAAMVTGYQLETYDHLTLSSISGILVFIGLSLIVGTLAPFGWKYLDRIYDKRRGITSKQKIDNGSITDILSDNMPDKESQRAGSKSKISAFFSYFDMASDKKYWLTIWGILIVLQIPVMLAEFPGFFCYDAQDELNQVLTRTFSTHHPLVHVLILGGNIALGHKLTGSWNIGICFHLTMQMLFMTGVFAYALTFLRKNIAIKRVDKASGNINYRGKKVYRTIAVLFFGLFPTIVMYTLCSTKDGLFSTFLLLLVIELMKLLRDTENFFKLKRHIFLLILSAMMMSLLRHNGFYAYIVFIPFGVFALRKYYKKVLILFIIPVILSIVIESGLTAALNADSSEHQEMITVSIMQLARTWRYTPEDFSEEDKEVLLSFLSERALGTYEIRAADYMKSFFDNAEYDENSGAYWKLWAKMMGSHPMTYINAWLLTCYPYWYPFAVINPYRGHQMPHFTYEDSSYFEYEVEPPGERHTLAFGFIDKLYYKMSLTPFQQKTPIVSLLFSMGFYFWVWMYFAFYTITKRKLLVCLPLMPVFLTWLTLMLGPVALIRYMLILWYITPLLPVFFGHIYSSIAESKC